MMYSQATSDATTVKPPFPNGAASGHDQAAQEAKEITPELISHVFTLMAEVIVRMQNVQATKVQHAAGLSTKVQHAADLSTKVQHAADLSNLSTKVQHAADLSTKVQHAADLSTKVQHAAGLSTKAYSTQLTSLPRCAARSALAYLPRCSTQLAFWSYRGKGITQGKEAVIQGGQ
jgi:hypothetical protein